MSHTIYFLLIMKITSSYPSLRMRRNRKSDWIRRLVSEHNLSTNDLILPLFVKEGVKNKASCPRQPSNSPPGGILEAPHRGPRWEGADCHTQADTQQPKPTLTRGTNCRTRKGDACAGD